MPIKTASQATLPNKRLPATNGFRNSMRAAALLSLAIFSQHSRADEATPDTQNRGAGDWIVADNSSSEIHALLKGREDRTIWVDAGQDPIDVISGLSNHGASGGTVHLVAHGSAGSLIWGGVRMDRETLIRSAARLADWKSPRVAIWSCEVGQDREFVRLLSELTHAEVFASSRTLGKSGGESNWSLDISSSGSASPVAPFEAPAMASWDHTLAKLNFTNAYPLNLTGGSPPASKEQSSFDINYATPTGSITLDDNQSSQLFSGNDVAAELKVGSTSYFGWISRPIKSGGTYRGFYMWIDPQFTSLALATADGNADADGNEADNVGFALVFDQAWFDSQLFNTPTSLKTISSSSDRVDNALNSLIPPNTAPVVANDSDSVLEDGGPVTGNVLTNDSDTVGDVLSVTQFVFSGNTYTVPAAGSKTQAIPGIGSLTIGSNGSFSFTPLANYNGSVPVITYTVSDGDLTSTGTLTLSVTPVNDAPSGTDKTITLTQDTSVTLAAADFGFSDPIDNPASSLSAVKITALPASGQLLYNGTAITQLQVDAGYEVSAADLAANKLTFVPSAGASGNPYASFSFKVRDNGGVLNGGVDLDPIANLITFTVTANALTVTSTIFNEASPYAFFTVGGAAGQLAKLALSDGSATSADYGSGLEYYNGSAWVNYTAGTNVAIGAGGTLLVRTPLKQDTTNEIDETFKLTATNTANIGYDGTATIVDDGNGVVYNDDGTVNGSAVKDDDRPLAVSDIIVNEGSPYTCFVVTGAVNQLAQLSLSTGTAISADYGSALEYYNGSAWVAYSPGTNVSLGAGGRLLVRTSIVKDTVLETSENFKLNAANTGGNSFNGTCEIRDDGTGNIWLATNTSGNPEDVNAPGYTGPQADDDRPLAVTSPTVNEGSPYVVFTVSGAAGQLTTLALSDGSASGADFGPALEYYNGSTWVAYTAGSLVPLDAAGKLLVRTTIKVDSLSEISETFSLVASNTGGTSYNGTAEIRDDGTGDIFPDDPTGANDPLAPKDDDRPLVVNDVTYHESLGHAIFTVTGAALQEISLNIVDGTATGSDYGPGLEYLDGTVWKTYAGGFIPLPSSGSMSVRVALTDDGIDEGLETFNLVATNRGGSPYSGVARVPDRWIELFVMEGTTDAASYADHFTGQSQYQVVGGPNSPHFVAGTASPQLAFPSPVVYILGGNNQYRAVAQGSGADKPDQALFIVNVMSLGAIKFEALTALALDRQSGLYKQKIRVSNLHVHSIQGFRFTVPLPAGAKLFNANTTTGSGAAAIYYDGTLAAKGLTGSFVEMTVEVLYQPLTSPGTSLATPAYAADKILTSTVAGPTPSRTEAPVVGFRRLTNGDYMIEWDTTVGRVYAIEYSKDLTTWKRVPSLITANAQRTQWIDNGLPKTESHPSQAPSRFYRVVLLPE